jgi:hypothetical protein
MGVGGADPHSALPRKRGRVMLLRPSPYRGSVKLLLALTQAGEPPPCPPPHAGEGKKCGCEL